MCFRTPQHKPSKKTFIKHSPAQATALVAVCVAVEVLWKARPGCQMLVAFLDAVLRQGFTQQSWWPHLQISWSLITSISSCYSAQCAVITSSLQRDAFRHASNYMQRWLENKCNRVLNIKKKSQGNICLWRYSLRQSRARQSLGSLLLRCRFQCVL